MHGRGGDLILTSPLSLSVVESRQFHACCIVINKGELSLFHGVDLQKATKHNDSLFARKRKTQISFAYIGFNDTFLASAL
jgi:hypothetical protein